MQAIQPNSVEVNPAEVKALGLTLFVVTLLVNAVARWLVGRVAREGDA